MNGSNESANEGKENGRIIKNSARDSALCYHSTERLVVKIGSAT
jgi:hypothetical protein